MAMSPQAVVFGIQSLMRLGNAGRKAYQARVLDDDVTLPTLDVSSLPTPMRAAQIVRNSDLPAAQWEDDYNRVRAEDTSPAGLAAQTRIIETATRLNPEFAEESELDGLAVLEQWSSAANRKSPAARIGIELADIALDYIGANPALFGADGNGSKLITAVAANLGELLPDPDDPNPPPVNFVSSAIRIFVEAGLRVVNDNVDDYIDEAHLQDVASSILKPMIIAVSDPAESNEPWYDLRDEFLGPISEAAIGALARNQAAILGKDFKLDSEIGLLTQSLLVSIKDNGLQDDFGKQGVLRVYSSMLDAVINQPGVFLGDAQSKADELVSKILVNAAATLKTKSPPFIRPLAVELVASSFETVSANAAVLVPDIDADQWTTTVAEISEVLIREISEGLAAGLANGNPKLFQHLFNREQAAELIHIIVEDVAATPGMVADGKAPEVHALVETIARAMATQQGQLMSADNWLDVASIAATEVASNPGRLLKLDQGDAEQQLLFQLISAVMSAAAEAADTRRVGGSVLFGPLLVEAMRTVIESAAGNATKALQNIAQLKELVAKLTEFSISYRDSVGKREWLQLFRMHVAAVIDTGELPDLEPDTLLTILLER